MPDEKPRVEVEVGGANYQAFRVEGRIAVSELYFLTLDLAFDGEDHEALLGKEYVLTLANDAAEQWTIRGVVFGVERHFRGEEVGLRLELAPMAASLSLGSNSRLFQETDVTAIIEQVLGDAAVVCEMQTTRTYPQRPYVVQYQESDWAFVERLAAEAGIYYFFLFGDDETKVVFADSSSDGQPIAGDPALAEVDPNSMLHEAASVTSVQATWRVASDAAAVIDYNHQKPALELKGESKSDGGLYEIYEYNGRSGEPEEVTAVAETLLESSRARSIAIRGVSSCLRLHPGFVFELSAAHNDGLDGQYFLREASLVVVERLTPGTTTPEEAAEGIRVNFGAQPVGVPFRPPAYDRVKRMSGPQSGVVCGPSGAELHTSDTGFIRVQPYWDREGQRDEKSTTWMRTGQFALGGSMVLPRIGWDVLVDFHHDDVDQPFVSGHLYDGQYPVPYALPANKTRTSWQTATTPGDGTASEIRFEDKAGSEEIFVNATKDMTVSVGDCSDAKIGANHTHEVGADRTIDVGSNAQNAVTGDQTVTVGASETCSVTGDYSSAVTGSNSASIGASRSATATMGVTTEAKGGRTLTVGGSMLGASGLGVSRATMGTNSISVGGSWIMAAAVGVSNATAGASAESVGGAKIQAAGGGVSASTMGAMAENVGGAYIAAAGGDAGESSGGPLVLNVGGAFVAAGPKVHIKAESKITVRAGGASLSMTGSKVTVSAPSMLSPGATIAKTGGTVKHN